MFDHEEWNLIKKEVHEIFTTELDAVEREQYEAVSKFITLYNKEQDFLKLQFQFFLNNMENKKKQKKTKNKKS